MFTGSSARLADPQREVTARSHRAFPVGAFCSGQPARKAVRVAAHTEQRPEPKNRSRKSGTGLASSASEPAHRCPLECVASARQTPGLRLLGAWASEERAADTRGSACFGLWSESSSVSPVPVAPNGVRSAATCSRESDMASAAGRGCGATKHAMGKAVVSRTSTCTRNDAPPAHSCSVRQCPCSRCGERSP